jgi:hypothetical protein
MANPSITLDNVTASPITLAQLGLLVPGSGSILATDSVLVDDVINDPELNIFIDAGDITLTVDAVALTEEQSKAYVGYDRVLDNNGATVAPTVNDDADAGYRVGSMWLDVTNDSAYVCVDATNNAAVWVALGGDDAFGTPVTIGTANAEGAAATHSRSDHVHAHGAQTDETLHALVTTTTDGFMSAEDKTKLDALVGQVGDTEFSSVNTSTTSFTFQDAFPAQNITVVTTGAYLIMFEGNIEATNGNTVNEIGVTIDTGGGPIIVSDSQRVMQGNGGAAISTFCHTFSNLTAGDVVTGAFRRNSGSGTTSMDNRRISIFRLSVVP